MRRALAVPLALCLIAAPALEATPAPASPGAYFQDEGGYQNYSPEQLDNLLSPIALYPDPLLAQVMVAATFPDQIEEAARWVRANGQNGIDDQYWDVSVKSVAHYPTVIEMMADKIDWTTAVGQAYVNQSTDVSASIQHLRHMARGVGNLESTPQQEVLVNGDYIGIYPYQPQYIYVPVYDPAICYYRRPYWGPAISFGSGFVVGAWLNLGWHWGGPGIYYTGWHSDGWYGGWVNRCRPNVHVTNVYVNNRYTNVTINRTVINRTVNVTNINHYNYIHKNVTYNNVQVNNTRINNRVAINNGGRPGPGNRPGNDMRPVINNPGVNNKIIDRNIDRNNPRIDQYRGRDNNVRNDRPPDRQERTLPAQQTRPIPQNNNRPAFNRPAPQQPQFQQPQRPQNQMRPMPQPSPHTFNRSENNFDPRVSSQRGQMSRQQAVQPQPRPAPQARPAPQPRAENRPAPQQHGGGERRRP